MDGINVELHINDLFRIFDKLRHVHDKYASYFRSKTRNSATQSFKYIQEAVTSRGVTGDSANELYVSI